MGTCTIIIECIIIFLYWWKFRKEIPCPTKNLENCHKLWVKIMMDKTYLTKIIYSLCSSNELTPDLLDSDKTLKECQQKIRYIFRRKKITIPNVLFGIKWCIIRYCIKKK